MSDQPLKPWEWPEPTWRRMVDRARAGRSLAPASWPGGARCCVALSFDADHDTTPLRDSDESPMRISQGQYGSRRGIPRIRALLERYEVKASFFYPAVSALIYPEEVRALAGEGHEIGIHSWIHEANTTLPPSVERGGCAGEDRRPPPGRHPHRLLGLLGRYDGHHPGDGPALRQQPDGR
jgi:peptidoglycan-N-acetylglucosamine deacetylase